MNYTLQPKHQDCKNLSFLPTITTDGYGKLYSVAFNCNDCDQLYYVVLFELTTCIKFFDGVPAFPPIVYASSPSLSANRVYLHSHNMKC